MTDLDSVVDTTVKDERSDIGLRDKPSWLRGVIRAAPIVMGYIPIGFAYGVLARQAGLSLLNTVLMSILVYAGSAQFIAVGLFAAQVPALSIVMTTFVVNLRHLLFSAALSPYLTHWRRGTLAAFAYELTDESFALHSAQFASERPDQAEALTLNATAQVSWVIGSALGALMGQLITDVEPLALDYTLPALFIALLVMQIKGRKEIVVAGVAGVLAVVLSVWGMDQWSVIFATVIGATVGLLLERAGTAARDTGKSAAL